MKKIIFTLAMMVSSMFAFAQYEVGTFSICPQVGLSASQVVITKDTPTELSVGESRYKAGLVGGLELEYQAKKWLGLSAGALYTQAGAHGRVGSGIDMKYDYITMPVLANFYPCKGLCLKVGLQPSVNLSAKATENGKPMECYGKDNINKFDMQIPVGISYETHGFIIDARYNFGVTNMLKNSSNANTNIGMHNSCATLTIGYKFHL